jgi:hypothetical protein
MKIAHVTIHVAPELMQGGVGKKIQSQIKIWREKRHEVALFSLTPVELNIPGIRQFRFHNNLNLLQREIQRSVALKKMLASIQEYKPHLIYLRYGLYSYPLHHVFKIAPVVVEINSNDIIEYRSRGHFFYWLNRLTRNLTLAPACGYIFPTYELADAFRVPPEKYVSIISNGMDVKEAQAFPPTNHKHPTITLVGSPGMDWHGVDKLIQLAKIYSDLQINIVGYLPKDVDETFPMNVHFHGFLGKDELLKVLAQTDVACGTLALHRKSMQEASPLKVREALTYGLPIILGYKDTDLENVKSKMILRIPNTEDNIINHAESIYKFAYEMIGKRVRIEEIAPYLDQLKKEEIRLNFFQTIIEQCK